MKRAVLMALLTACAADRDDVGPTIHVRFDSDIGSATDTDATPDITLFSDPDYSLTITVESQAGTEETNGKLSTFALSSFHLTLAAPGATLPDLDEGDFMKDDFLGSPTFSRDEPIAIPGSAKGSSLTVHLAGEDSRGLSSNVIDFAISLE